MIVTTLEHGELHIESRINDGFDMVLQPRQNVVYYKAGQKNGSDTRDTKQNLSETASTVQSLQKPTLVTNNVNTDLYTSWKDTEWVIEAQTFGDLATSLERRFNVQVLFGSPDLKNYRFSGTIRKETLEQVLNVLTYTAPMQYKVDQGVVQLLIDQKRKRNYDELSN